MRSDKKNRANPEKNDNSSVFVSHIRDSAEANEQVQWERKMHEKNEPVIEKIDDIQQEAVYNNSSTATSFTGHVSFIPSPEESISKEETKESHIERQNLRSSSSYSVTDNKKKEIWEQEEENRKKDVEVINELLPDKNASEYNLVTEDDLQMEIKQSHLRDSSVQNAQHEWEINSLKTTSPDILNASTSEKKISETQEENAIPEPSKAEREEHSPANHKESHLRDSALDKQQDSWNENMKRKLEQSTNLIYDTKSEDKESNSAEEDIMKELVKKRDEIQKKASSQPDSYTLQTGQRFLTNGMTKILGSQKRIVKSGKDVLWRQGVTQTNTGRGIKETSDNILPFIDMAIDTTKKALSLSIAGSIADDKAFQEAYTIFEKAFNISEDNRNRLIHVDVSRAMTRDDFRILQNDIRRILREKGIGDFSSNPVMMKLQLKRAIKSGRLTLEEAKSLQILVNRISEVGCLTGKSNRYHLLRFSRKKIHKYGRQESSMNAMFVTKAFIQHTANIARNALITIKKAAFAVKNATKIANLAAAKAAVKLSETDLAKKVSDKLPEGVKTTHSELKKQRKKYKVAKQKIKKKKNRIRDSIDIVIDKVPHPVKATKKKINHAKAEVFGLLTRGKYNPLRFLTRAFAFTQQVKTILICSILGFFLIYVVIVAIILIIAAMSGQYAMETNEIKTNEYCLKKIEQLYKDQQNSLASYNSGGAYRNVTINKVDKKSDPIYDEELDFKETTNTAEMMSMAQVYFDFDLDEAKQESVENYLTGLYYGTHTTDIKETDHYTKDEDGNKILDYTDAEITLTTYYFDDIFDCALGSSNMFGSESPMAGQAIDIPQNYPQMWTVTKYDSINWGYDCGKLYNAWKQAGSNWDDGFACINIGGKNYRFIAVLGKFGKVGDYMTVQLDDGTNINCIIADTKRASECPNGWGHMEGNTLSVVEWEVSTSYFNRYGNPGSGYGRELRGRKAARLINGGSYFKNPSGPNFVSSGVVDGNTGQTANANSFLSLLDKYSSFIKQNSAYIRYGNLNNQKTYNEAKSDIADKENVTINCVSPVMWGLKELGLIPKGSSFYSTTDGSWHCSNMDKLKQKAIFIKSGEAIGMTVVDAAKKGLLQPGDIIANKNFNHTYVYVGYDESQKNIIVYEAGGNAKGQGYNKVGCGPFVAGQYKHLQIASIIRWR